MVCEKRTSTLWSYLVNDRESFIDFLRLLSKNYEQNPEEWENRDIAAFLQGMASWIEDMDGYYENNNLAPPTDIDWMFLPTFFMPQKSTNNLDAMDTMGTV